jgi:signal transduction histidine kinase
MEERAALAGGTIELRSAPGHGTVLLATFAVQPGVKETEL